MKDIAQQWKIAEAFATKIAGYTKGSYGEFFNKDGNYVGRGDCLLALVESTDSMLEFLMDFHDTSKLAPRGGVLISIRNSLSLGSKAWELELSDVYTNKQYRCFGTSLGLAIAQGLLAVHGIDPLKNEAH